MQLRTRIFIVASLIVLVILALSILLLIQAKNKKINPAPVANNPTQTTGDQNQVVPGITPTVIPTGMAIKQATPAEVEENAVRKLARVFVERYYSYSSDSNFTNAREVKPLVTNSFWSKISAKLSSTPATSFVAATTEVVSILSSSIKDNSATVDIKARKTSEQSGITSAAYVEYNVSLVKIGDMWLVNDAVVKQ